MTGAFTTYNVGIVLVSAALFALSGAAKSAFTDALGLAVLIGSGFSLLVVARFMPARHTNVSEDDDSSLQQRELKGPFIPIDEPSGAGDHD